MYRILFLSVIVISIFVACDQKNNNHEKVVELEEKLDARGDSLRDTLEIMHAQLDQQLDQTKAQEDTLSIRKVADAENKLRTVTSDFVEWQETLNQVSSGHDHAHEGHSHDHTHGVQNGLSEEEIYEVLQDLDKRLNEIEEELETIIVK